MDRLGNQLLPCSALAGYQNRSVGRSNPGNRPQHIHQRGTLANDLIKMKFIIGIQAVQRCFQFLLLFAQFDCRTDGFQQNEIVSGLGHKIESSCLHPLHGKRNGSPCRHQDNRDVGWKIFTCFSSCIPSSPVVVSVKFISIRINCGTIRRTTANASSGPGTASGSNPARFNKKVNEERTAASSSIIRIIDV